MINSIKQKIIIGNNEVIYLVKPKKMQRQNIIVFIQADRIETYGNLKKCCEAEKLKYHTLSRLKFPILLNDFEIHKTIFK